MKNEQLIAALQKCVRECLNCANACLDEENVKKMVSCIRTDRACAEVCQVGANLLAMDASNAGDVIRLCRTFCETCADECEKHEHQHCKDCARACRECAEACASYAA